MSEQLVWESAVEGLYVRAVGARLTPALRAELKALGLDLGVKLPPGLSRDVWYACLHATARHLAPELPHAEGLRLLGRWTVEGIAHTFWGRAMSQAVALLGPRRLLLRFPSQMRSTNNYATGVVEELAPTHLKLEVSDAGDAPEMIQGSLEQLATWAGAHQVTVRIERPAPPAATYFITWVL
jgi:uncharacterized protein (TIGR02265 family)